MTTERLGPEMIGLVPDLAKFVPPARTFDKHVYSPWTGSDLDHQLRNSGIDTLVITGGETDVCVLATVLGAVDWGFRVILVTDALCSSADETHDAMMNVYWNRFGEQVETVTTHTLLDSWPRGVVFMTSHPSHLIQIILPKETGGGHQSGSNGSTTYKMNLPTSLAGRPAFCAPRGRVCGKIAEGIQRDEIAVIEIMARSFDREFWRALRARLERELSQQEIVIRAQRVVVL